jgi:hypothetical protein
VRLLLKPKDGSRDDVRGLVVGFPKSAAAPPLDSIREEEGVMAPLLLSLGLRPDAGLSLSQAFEARGASPFSREVLDADVSLLAVAERSEDASISKSVSVGDEDNGLPDRPDSSRDARPGPEPLRELD